MEDQVILIARYWLNLWKPRHRSAISGNVWVALAYDGSAGALIDMGPRRPARRLLPELLMPEIIGKDLIGGSPITLRKPDVKMGLGTSRSVFSARIEPVLFELQASLEQDLNPNQWEAATEMIKIGAIKALEPWLGTPLLSRAQWSDEHSGGLFPSGGDPGVIAGYLYPTGMGGGDIFQPEHDAWQAFLREAESLDLARTVPKACDEKFASQLGRPRI